MNKIIALAFFLFTSTILSSQTNESKSTDTSKPFVLGVIDEIQSKELGEKRILNIYLPEGYKADDSTKYPVIYLLDGSADEDFIHIAGLVQFNSFEWVNQVPKSIVVGIATIDRRRDFTFPTTIEKDQKRFATSGHSDKFIAFIEKELQPFIDKKYKTNDSKTIIGQSLGGLLETEILLKKPTLFNKYVIVSPSIWWNNGSILNQDSVIFQENFNQKTEVYVAVGKEGLTPTEIPRVMEIDANLLAEKIKASKSKNIKVYFDYFPQENHATILHPAVASSFKFFYQIKEKE
ncbi:alpha/beta hydrolase [Flavobacterium piscisymbiosum]|uniref:Alpha/beta hydrolase n=1 Tax=Flavobacterium piscisymbiosum TaxID=2893753 RepID=A0ABS8ME80_9FLAO|nr:alpha/beta hydrolase-fold protein [Flavobacterium sp. F-30]MCC9063791.1 alpha/beta hydrolase [Flavobacterium sp. F-30]